MEWLLQKICNMKILSISINFINVTLKNEVNDYLIKNVVFKKYHFLLRVRTFFELMKNNYVNNML